MIRRIFDRKVEEVEEGFGTMPHFSILRETLTKWFILE
jgi:hypothetical protein